MIGSSTTPEQCIDHTELAPLNVCIRSFRRILPHEDAYFEFSWSGIAYARLEKGLHEASRWEKDDSFASNGFCHLTVTLAI